MMTTNADLTWPSLLAHWTAFAQASLALPKTNDGERWRAAVAPIIGLQAVTFALGDLDKLSLPGARAEALDKGELLVRSHTGTLHAIWRGESLPGELASIIHDATTALRASREGGFEFRVVVDKLVARHPAELVTWLEESGFAGDLYLPVAGAAVFKGAPAAFVRGPLGERPDTEQLVAVREFLGGIESVGKHQRVGGMRQVYRQFDFATGNIARDFVAPMTGELIAGQAQLVPVIQRGRSLPVNLPIPGMANIEAGPVVFVEEAEGRNAE